MLEKVVLTAEEANSVFEEVHCSHFGGHFGVEKNHSAIVSWYYWSAMEEAFFPSQVRAPLKLVRMGMWVSSQVATGGNQYILTDQG